MTTESRRDMIEEVKRAASLLIADGEAIELRAVNVQRDRGAPYVVRGYYDADSIDKLARDAVRLSCDDKAPGVYVTLQQINDALLSRSYNRSKRVGRADASTSDADVERYRWLPIDLDPKRPKGIASSDAEHEAAHTLARRIRDELVGRGWPQPLYADSGNGAHLLWRIDLPATEDGKAVVKALLGVLSKRYSNDAVELDTAVHNPARIWKLYGTISRKGDHTPRRPHRMSRIIDEPASGPGDCLVTVDMMLELLDEADEAEPVAKKRSRSLAFNDPRAFDLVEWARRVRINLPPERDWQPDSGPRGVKYVFDERHPCPMARGCTDGGGSLHRVGGGGTISFVCQHNGSCVSTWQEFRAALDPEWVEKQRRWEDRQNNPRRPRRTHDRPERHNGVEHHIGLPPDRRERVEAPPAPPAPPAEEARAPMPWEARLQRSQNDNVKNTAHNLALILAHDERVSGLLRLDAFAQRVVKHGRAPWEDDAGSSLGHLSPSRDAVQAAWTDADTTRLRCWLGATWGVEPGVDRIHDAVVVAAEANAYHPVRDYLRALPAWDGVDRLDHWLVDHLGVERSDYASAVGRWWMISAVARIMRPGCKVDHVLILEGPQGLGKSTAVQSLLPSDEWYSDSTIDIGNKDAYLSMRGRWVIELAELDALSKKEASAYKAFITSASDKFRPPYGRLLVDWPRQCVFVGTVNPDPSGYLSDATGNRRFWPVKAREINRDGLAAARDQLWAEALHRLNAGERWWPKTRAEAALCRREQGERACSDAWEGPVASWLDERARCGVSFVSASKILEGALDIEPSRQGRREQRRVSAIMATLEGWEAARKRVGSTHVRGFRRVKLEAEG